SHLGVVSPALPGLDHPGLDLGEMLREPAAQLVHEGLGIVEEAIDEPDAPAIEALGARRQALAGHLGRIATRVMDGDECHFVTPASAYRKAIGQSQLLRSRPRPLPRQPGRASLRARRPPQRGPATWCA